MDHDRFSLPLLIGAIIIIVTVSIIDYFFIKIIENNKILNYFGILLMLIGITIRRLAVFSLGKHFTWKVNIFPEHELIKTGIYSKIRHPAYTGGALFLGGFVIAMNSVYGLIIMILSAPFLFYRIKVEEDALTKKFGKEYEEHKKKTKMLIPYLL